MAGLLTHIQAILEEEYLDKGFREVTVPVVLRMPWEVVAERVVEVVEVVERTPVTVDRG